jgi:hypothetical protein
MSYHDLAAPVNTATRDHGRENQCRGIRFALQTWYATSPGGLSTQPLPRIFVFKRGQVR